jgi:hypothetical protein
MNENKNEIDITAKNVEEFQKAQELLKTLPESILKQINSVKICRETLTCDIKSSRFDPIVISLPNNVIGITEDEDSIEIRCGNFKFIITEPTLKNSMINYAFIRCDNIK